MGVGQADGALWVGFYFTSDLFLELGKGSSCGEPAKIL